MEFNNGLGVRIVIGLMMIASARSIEVSPLPSGLMRTKTDIDTVRAMWTLVVTFPQDPPTDSRRLETVLREVASVLHGWSVPATYGPMRDRLVARLHELVTELRYGPGGPRLSPFDVNRPGIQSMHQQDLEIPQVQPGALLPDRHGHEETYPTTTVPTPDPSLRFKTVKTIIVDAPQHKMRMRTRRIDRSAAPIPGPQTSHLGARKRRGLLPILGDLGKSLFGLATEKDIARLRAALEDNRRYTDAVRHDQEGLLSVVNITRAESVRNSKNLHVMGGIVRALEGQLKLLANRTSAWTAYNAEFDKVRDKISHLASQVRRVWYRRQQYLAARRDLEGGSLSELLLPLDDLKAISQGRLPRGTRFVRPLLWYYSKADVRMTSVSGDLVYVVRLPLVDETDHQAIRLVSFPVPNVRRNVTVQIDAGGLISLNPVTGQTVGLDPDLCMGRDPMVCIPGPSPRHVQDKLTCVNAVFVEKDVRKYCSAKVAARDGDSFQYHDMNDYILTTWGTTLREQCDWGHPVQLSPGVYRVKWSGRCSLCTPEYCIPSTIQIHSSYHLQQWEPLNVTDISIPVMKVEALAGLPSIPHLGEVKTLRLDDLLTATPPPPFSWTREHTSVATDSVVGLVVAVLVVLALVLCIRRYGCTGWTALCRKPERIHFTRVDSRSSSAKLKVQFQRTDENGRQVAEEAKIVGEPTAPPGAPPAYAQ